MVIKTLQPPLTGPIGGDRRLSGLAIKADLSAMSSFPEYVDPFASSEDTMPDSATVMSAANRLVEKIKGDDEPGRHPSPQPTHMSYPAMPKGNGNGHRVLRSGTVGYVAPEFKGKQEQMKLGQSPGHVHLLSAHSLTHQQSRTTSQNAGGFLSRSSALRSSGSTTSWASTMSTSRLRTRRSLPTTSRPCMPPRSPPSRARTSGKRSV